LVTSTSRKKHNGTVSIGVLALERLLEWGENRTGHQRVKWDTMGPVVEREHKTSVGENRPRFAKERTIGTKTQKNTSTTRRDDSDSGRMSGEKRVL